MKSNIFIPKTINVGYQNRSGTYTGKLAYVIYYDERGKLRKEASWNSWRDEKIPNEKFDNVPTTGFVLNKKVGDYSSGWDHRQAYCRVYDPRNFEFEITIENLLYILENANSIKGKGLEGEFVYGWDGKDLVLMPVESPDYKQISEYNKIVHNNESIKAKDLIIGAIYLTKDNEKWIYVGRFDYYDSGYRWTENGEIKTSKSGKEIPRVHGRYGYEYIDYDYIDNYPYGKYYWFAIYDNDTWNFKQFKSIPNNKFISCIDDKCTSKYSDIFWTLEGSHHYSPYDPLKDVLCNMTLEDFLDLGIKKYDDGRIYYSTFKFISSYGGNDESYLADDYYGDERGKFQVKKYIKADKDRWTYGYRVGYDTKVLEPMELNKIFEIMKPKYIQKYLANGRKYEREYKI